MLKHRCKIIEIPAVCERIDLMIFFCLIFSAECKINSDCPYDKACINEKCLNPCSYGNVQCGTGAQCLIRNHQAECQCPAGTQGNPFISCITGLCQYNEDCADHEACDRLNRICKPVCDDDTCAQTAICHGKNHQPYCECKPGSSGNPYIGCVFFEPIPSLECNVDADCSSQLACINSKCVNPCNNQLNVCSPQQICSVLDTLPLRTIICKCPNDLITDNARNCVPIKHDQPPSPKPPQIGCQNNDNCQNTEICQRGNCIDACRLDQCGVNAVCRSINHYAQCTCPPGYEGNPRIECIPSKYSIFFFFF